MENEQLETLEKEKNLILKNWIARGKFWTEYTSINN